MKTAEKKRRKPVTGDTINFTVDGKNVTADVIDWINSQEVMAKNPASGVYVVNLKTTEFTIVEKG